MPESAPNFVTPNNIPEWILGGVSENDTQNICYVTHTVSPRFVCQVRVPETTENAHVKQGRKPKFDYGLQFLWFDPIPADDDVDVLGIYVLKAAFDYEGLVMDSESQSRLSLDAPSPQNDKLN